MTRQGYLHSGLRASRNLRAAALLAAVATATPILHANIPNDTYTGPSGGSWDTNNNWSVGVPSTDVNALITEAPTSLFSVNFNYDYSSSTAIGVLALDSSSTSGGVELNQTTSGDNLFSSTEFVGYNGSGSSIYSQTAATNGVSDSLILGYGTDSTGAYSLSGTGSLTVGNAAYVGYGGTGTFAQNGGTVTITSSDSNDDSLSLGEQVGSNGTYNLSGGTLGADYYESVGFQGSGTFTQSGGANSGFGLILGSEAGGSGSYSLSNGSLSESYDYVGGGGAGVFVQSGGMVSASTNLVVGYYAGSSGTYNQTGGSVTTDTLYVANSAAIGTLAASTGVYSLGGTAAALSVGVGYVGYSGIGTFTQSGGSATFTSYDGNGISLSIGDQAGSNGTFILSGGVLNWGEVESIGTHGNGTFVQSGGTNWGLGIMVGNLSGGNGTYNQSGGFMSAFVLDVGADASSIGIYSLSGGGALSVDNGYVGDGGIGTFTQSGGSATFAYDDSNGDSLGLGEVAGSKGTYILSGGALSWNYNESIGVSGDGTFIQSGGTNSGDAVVVGNLAGGNGTYNQSGGYMAAATLYVAYSTASGTLAASSGVYSLGGGAALSAGLGYVGYEGSGTFTQSGGSATFTGSDENHNSLSLGDQADGQGEYILSGGTLGAYDNETAGTIGSGTFAQSGGTNSADYLILGYYDGSNGTYTLSGGTLNVTSGGYEAVGGEGAGTFLQSGGANNATAIYLAFYPISTGTYSLSGGTVTTAQVVSDGTIAQTGGTASLGAVTGTGDISIGNASGSSAVMTVSSITQEAITILSTGNLTITPNSFTTTNALDSLIIDGNGTLNLTNNALYIEYGSNSDPIANIKDYLAGGYNGGGWNGPGIDTTSPTDGRYGLGYADSADPENPAGLPSGEIEIKYTLYGDANLDGVVNGVDFGILAANFGKSGKNWDEGAFTYDGIVNGVDFGLLASNFGKSASGAAVQISGSDWAALDAFAQANGLMAYVPEPASGGLIAMAAAGLLARRRRRR